MVKIVNKLDNFNIFNKISGLQYHRIVTQKYFMYLIQNLHRI